MELKAAQKVIRTPKKDTDAMTTTKKKVTAGTKSEPARKRKPRLPFN
jgi:hypothetical protein